MSLIEQLTEAAAGLTLRELSPGLINVGAQGRPLTREDVDTVRAALTEGGYREVESWVATEGLSWLSSGIKTVSIRIEEIA